MEPIICQVMNLSVFHLGAVITTNGYRGEFRGVAIADDPFYVEVLIDDIKTWVKPDAPCRIEAPE
jgi:hypothetical protein